MRLAITGGAGFLGLHLADLLSGEFDEIRLLDIAPVDPEEYPKNTTHQRVDVRDREALSPALEGVHLVVHAAAALPLWRAADIVSTNATGTQNVLEAAGELGIERVVFVSSTAVYGIPEVHPIREDDRLHGVGPYGESKIEAERICQRFRDQGLIVPIVRPKTFVGTGRLGVFQILYDWIRSGKKIPIIGPGDNRYQLLEVEDLVEALTARVEAGIILQDLVEALRLLLSLPRDQVNDTFNIGAGEFGTVGEDVGALCEFAGSGARAMSMPAGLVKPVLAAFWRMRLSPLYPWVYATADKDSFVSIERAVSRLGWTPRFSNAQALIRSYQWYLDHRLALSGSGTTHRIAWRQGILGLIKRFL
ncbi:MAG: NAD-dependent epimerase/dehydratase family protein [Anaerolineae bacterium]